MIAAAKRALMALAKAIAPEVGTMDELHAADELHESASALLEAIGAPRPARRGTRAGRIYEAQLEVMQSMSKYSRARRW